MAAAAEEALKAAKLEKLKFHEFFTTKFRGDGRQDPEAHILLFKRLCTELKYITVSDAGVVTVSAENLILIKNLFFKTLAEKALLWYDSCDFESLDDLCTGFLRHYSGSHGISGDLTQFNSLCWSQGETAKEFKNRLKAIADRLKLPETLVKHRFIHGLPDSMRPQLLPFYNAELKDILEMAQNLLNMNTTSKFPEGAVGANCAATPTTGGEDAISGLKADIGSLRREFSEMKLSVDGLYSSSSHFSEGYYPEDEYSYYEDISPEFDSYYSNPHQFRSSFRRPGRGFRSFRGGYRGPRSHRGGFRGQRWLRGGYRNAHERGSFGNVQDTYAEPPQRFSPVNYDFDVARSSQRDERSSDTRFCKFCRRGGHTWQFCYDLQGKIDSNEKVFH